MPTRHGRPPIGVGVRSGDTQWVTLVADEHAHTSDDPVAAAQTPDPAGVGPRERLRLHVRRRAPALAAIGIFIALSLAYTFLWAPLVRHTSLWIAPGDIWATWRNAHMIGWGDIGAIYDPYYGLLTFPGVVVALTPSAMVSGHFGLAESLNTWRVPHPSAWYVLGRAMLLLGSFCLLAFDAVAEELGVHRSRRRVLLGGEAAVVFLVVTLWGHPEDMLALGCAVYAVLMAEHGRWSSAGWLWGAAMAFQPLVLLLLLLLVVWSRVPRGERGAFVIRAVVPSAVLLAIPLATQWHMTTQAMLHQQNLLRLNHPTPWVALSTPLGHGAVSVGPGRMVALVAAGCIGLLVMRIRPSLLGLL